MRIKHARVKIADGIYSKKYARSTARGTVCANTCTNYVCTKNSYAYKPPSSFAPYKRKAF